MIKICKLKDVKDLLKKYDKMSYIGELKVAEKLFLDFGGEIKNIEWSPQEGIDLQVFFNNRTNPLLVEVKSSAFKNDYLKDCWIYGIPIKVKDFKGNFDILAMVNFFPPNKKNMFNSKNKKLRSDLKSEILFFHYHELKELDPNPYKIIPNTTLSKLKEICGLKEAFSNFYKAILVESSFIFRIGNFNELNNNEKYKGKLSFPESFGYNEPCVYIRNYHASIRNFFQNIILDQGQRSMNLKNKVKTILDKVKTINDFKEAYEIEENYCQSCKINCEYYPIKRKI